VAPSTLLQAGDGGPIDAVGAGDQRLKALIYTDRFTNGREAKAELSRVRAAILALRYLPDSI
jgi:hypothetical protein